MTPCCHCAADCSVPHRWRAAAHGAAGSPHTHAARPDGARRPLPGGEAIVSHIIPPSTCRAKSCAHFQLTPFHNDHSALGPSPGCDRHIESMHKAGPGRLFAAYDMILRRALASGQYFELIITPPMFPDINRVCDGGAGGNERHQPGHCARSGAAGKASRL